MTDFSKPHAGPMVGYEVTSEGPKYEYEVHSTNGLTGDELRDAVAENHGIDPESFEIRSPRTFVDSKGRRGTSFAGAWANGACKWEPKGPDTTNHGYQSSVNLN